MNLKSLRIALIGGGNMGSALAAGLLDSGLVKPAQIFVAEPDPVRLRSLKKKFRVNGDADNAEAVRHGDVLVLCVKPQQMAVALAGLKGRVSPRHLVISIAAGVKTAFIEKALGGRTPVVRCMPNTPALYRAGALAYCLGRFAGKNHDALAKTILASVGMVWKTSEGKLDAVTALSGSGPAYGFFLAECMAAAGKALGLPADMAEALTRQTLYGAGLMLKQSAEPAALLRQRVTSPGGTTEAALNVLRKHQVAQIFKRALSAASRRSREMSR